MSVIVSVLTGLLQASRPVAAPVGCLRMEGGRVWSYQLCVHHAGPCVCVCVCRSVMCSILTSMVSECSVNRKFMNHTHTHTTVPYKTDRPEIRRVAHHQYRRP